MVLLITNTVFVIKSTIPEISNGISNTITEWLLGV